MSHRGKLINACCFLEGAVNRGGRFIRSAMGIAFEQLGKASFVEITNRAFTIGLDPFRMLHTKVVMNLKLKRRQGVVRLRPANRSGHRFRRNEHHRFDNHCFEVVQIDPLKICVKRLDRVSPHHRHVTCRIG